MLYMDIYIYKFINKQIYKYICKYMYMAIYINRQLGLELRMQANSDVTRVLTTDQGSILRPPGSIAVLVRINQEVTLSREAALHTI